MVGFFFFLFLPPGCGSTGAEVTETWSAGQEAQTPPSIALSWIPGSCGSLRIHLRGAHMSGCVREPIVQYAQLSVCERREEEVSIRSLVMP